MLDDDNAHYPLRDIDSYSAGIGSVCCGSTITGQFTTCHLRVGVNLPLFFVQAFPYVGVDLLFLEERRSVYWC